MAAAEHKEKAHPTFPLNRAAAYLKLNKNEDAERDCAAVLKLQSNNVKALFRRAQARVALGKLSDARADLVAAAKAEPGNVAVRTEFTKVEGLIAEAAKKAKAKAGKGTPISLPTRAPAPPEPSGSPYRRRVPITIVNDDTPEQDTKTETHKPKAIPAEVATPLKSILKNVSPSPSDHTSASLPVDPSVVSKPDSFLTQVSTRSLSSSELPSHKDPASASVPSTTTPTQLPTFPNPSISASSPKISTTTVPEPTASTPLPSKDTEESSSAFPLQPDSVPPTLLEFLQKWSNTRTDADRASVLYAIPPSSIPSLFGPTLESPLLGAMLSALSWTLGSAPNLPAADIPQRTMAYIAALARVPRFSTLILFLDVVEKKHAKDIWDGLEQSGVEMDSGERKKWGC
ncbi:unnamed protein product [Rhizoctonia solani]|uniref:RNA polymerase II-associated protein 3 n=1 Tax=Rhizoctonia solani TaxID=456999 RepID=A0A8H3DQ61_9AGAM|nr:unnamed protein product [Rhizoctonia solani]CAE6538718.1 unnamed protein product [Rhizoctonia solani]